MFTGKILTTLVAITTAVILLSQLTASSEIIPDIYEPYVNYALRPVIEKTCEKACTKKRNHRHHGHPGHSGHSGHSGHHGHSGKKLIGHFPDTVFVANNNLQPSTVMSTGTNFQGNMVGMAGLGVQASVNSQSVGSAETAFANFETASGVVNESYRENYDNKNNSCGCGATPCGCDSGNNGYGMQNMPMQDYSPFEATAPALPVAGMSAYELPVGEKELMDAQGEIQSVICRSRLMYSTMRRYGSGVGDPIRGDIAPMGCQTTSKTAARAADTLNSGAFAVMNGISSMSAQLTSAAITADTGAAVSALGGMDLSEAVASGPDAPVLTNATFLSNSAQLYLDETTGTPSRTTATNAALGEVAVGTSGQVVVTGYTGF